MDKVRLGVIGAGGMGGSHANRILKGEVPRCELVAICDINPEVFEKFPEQKHFKSSEELIRSGEVDAVVIATPHYGHTTIGIDALENGLHTLVEKPISVHKADAQRLIEAHKNKEQVFSAMFNQRTDPKYRRIKKIIDSGELGEIRRTNWIITDWFRSEKYYRSGGWRATWEGEGGGVLLNQCPHQLDLFQWICGLPIRVTAIGGFGKYHNIEVEDDVTAIFEYENGATGVFITTTGEAPGTNRFEIVGDRGKIICENNKVTFIRTEEFVSEWSKTTEERFGKPQVWNCEIPTNGSGDQHKGILNNFTEAILDGKELIAPAREGIRSVELGNAMLYSLMTNQPVDIPIDSAAYEKKLKQLIAESTYVKEVDETADADLSGSF